MKIPFTGIRRPRDAGSLSRRTLFALLFLLAGAGMGIFAKWLDTLTFDESSWLQRALGRIDPGGLFSGVAVWFLLALIIAVTSPTPFQAGLRVFLFYAGMCVSYQLYSIFVVRFTPAASYMLIWYGLTWSLELYQQTNARLWRQGQTADTVVLHHIVTERTIDDRIMAALRKKEKTQDTLIEAVKANLEVM